MRPIARSNPHSPSTIHQECRSEKEWPSPLSSLGAGEVETFFIFIKRAPPLSQRTLFQFGWPTIINTLVVP